MFAIKTLLVLMLLSLSMAAFASTYQDARGRFTLDVPTGWSVTATDEGAAISNGGSAYARILKVDGGGRDPRLIKKISDQIGMQWQNFMQNSNGEFTLSGRRGFFAFFSGINPKGVQALMRVVGAPVGEDVYIILMSFPANDIDTIKTALQQIENSFMLTSGKPVPHDVKPAPADMPASAPPAATHPANAAGWKEHYDDRLHVGMSLPAGWSIKTEGYTLVAQSQDHASTVLVEAFVARPGETAQTVLHNLGARHAALLAHSQVNKTAPQPNAGDTLVAALSYKNAAGKPGQARALCTVFQNSGMLYAIAASDAQFERERPSLLKALQSLRFGPPQAEIAPSSGGAKQNPPTGGAAQGKAVALKFEKWTDPKEHAFSVDVPTGWSVSGGAIRIASTHVNQTIMLESPNQDMFVRIGDPSMPLFLEPTPDTKMTYFYAREGQPFSPHGTFMNEMLKHMPAPDFNKWYLNQILKPIVSDLAFTKEESQPEAARQQAAELNQQAGGSMHTDVSVATTEFKGVNKANGKPVTGVLASSIAYTDFTRSPHMPNWGPSQLILMGCADDSSVPEHQAILQAVLERLTRTWLVDPEWSLRFQQQQQQGTQRVQEETNQSIEQTHRQFEANLAAQKQRSQQIARNGEESRQRMMGSYWKRVGARNDMQRQQANYYGDKTDVVNPATGQTYKVSSGSSYYYHDPRTNTILGTNSTTRPPVDFTPMQEF